jgi:hypothetical protein
MSVLAGFSHALIRHGDDHDVAAAPGALGVVRALHIVAAVRRRRGLAYRLARAAQRVILGSRAADRARPWSPVPPSIPTTRWDTSGRAQGSLGAAVEAERLVARLVEVGGRRRAPRSC